MGINAAQVLDRYRRYIMNTDSKETLKDPKKMKQISYTCRMSRIVQDIWTHTISKFNKWNTYGAFLWWVSSDMMSVVNN